MLVFHHIRHADSGLRASYSRSHLACIMKRRYTAGSGGTQVMWSVFQISGLFIAAYLNAAHLRKAAASDVGLNGIWLLHRNVLLNVDTLHVTKNDMALSQDVSYYTTCVEYHQRSLSCFRTFESSTSVFPRRSHTDITPIRTFCHKKEECH